jgi:hypothetical protein
MRQCIPEDGCTSGKHYGLAASIKVIVMDAGLLEMLIVCQHVEGAETQHTCQIINQFNIDCELMPMSNDFVKLCITASW